MHNSTETRVQVNPWPLTPKPVVVNRTNTTIVVKVVLDDILPFITHIGVQVIIALHSTSYNSVFLVFLIDL